jgi:hypothetical protein
LQNSNCEVDTGISKGLGFSKANDGVLNMSIGGIGRERAKAILSRILSRILF